MQALEHAYTRAKQDLDFTIELDGQGNPLAKKFLPEYQAKHDIAKAKLDLAKLEAKRYQSCCIL